MIKRDYTIAHSEELDCMDIDCIQYTFMYTCWSKYLYAGVVIKVDGAILLKHLRKMLNYAIILDL